MEQLWSIVLINTFQHFRNKYVCKLHRSTTLPYGVAGFKHWILNRFLLINSEMGIRTAIQLSHDLVFVRKQKVNYKKNWICENSCITCSVYGYVCCFFTKWQQLAWHKYSIFSLLYICVKRGHFDNVCAKLFEISFKNVFNYTVAR